MVNFIPQEKILEIQQASNIVQIISEYILLKQSGQNFIGLCPFHSEKTPSFSVNPEKKLFKCFGCGEGGTIFHFIMKQEGLGYVEAIKFVAAKSHIDLSHLPAKKVISLTAEKTHLFNVTNFASRLYHKILLDKKNGNAARVYLQQRQINSHSINTFCLGYAPGGWDTLIKSCKGHNITSESLEKAGLVLRKKEGSAYYDRFRNRLIFPIVNVRNQIVGFGGRTLDTTTPKYLNSPETILFNKSNVLYGINVAKNAILKQNRVILMEGYTDVIMAHQYGIPWSVAILGTAVTKQHLRLLRQYCSQVILLMDSDSAGLKSSDRSLDIFIEEEFDVKIAQLPKGYDPCDFLIAEGAEKFLRYINNAKDFFRFKIEAALSKWDMATISGKTNAINDVLSTAQKMPDIIKRNLLIKMISEEMSIEEAILRTHLKKLKRTTSIAGKPETVQRIDASSRAEQEILYLMLSCNDLIPGVIEEIGLSEFRNKDYLMIAEKIAVLYHQSGLVKVEDVLHLLEDIRLGKILTNIVTTEEFQNITNHRERLEAFIVFFRRRNSKKDITQTKRKILEVFRSGSSEEDINTLLDEFHKKSRNIHTLKTKHKL